MAKRPLTLPARSEITDDTPLHVATAARLAFPDNTLSGQALRNAAARGDLEYERLGGRIYTTLRWIREWRERNRYQIRRKPERDTLNRDDSVAARARAYRALENLRRPARPKS